MYFLYLSSVLALGHRRFKEASVKPTFSIAPQSVETLDEQDTIEEPVQQITDPDEPFIPYQEKVFLPKGVTNHDDAVKFAKNLGEEMADLLDVSLKTVLHTSIHKFVKIILPDGDKYDIEGILEEQIDPLEHSIVTSATPFIIQDLVDFLDDAISGRTPINKESLGALARKLEMELVFQSKESFNTWSKNELQRLMASIFKRMDKFKQQQVQESLQVLSSATENQTPLTAACRQLDSKEPAAVLDSAAPNAAPIYSVELPHLDNNTNAPMIVGLGASVLAAILGTAILSVISYLEILYELQPLLE